MTNRIAAALLITIALASCAGTPTGTRSARDEAVAAWRAVTDCFRAHGFNVPDATIDDQGNASFPNDVPRTPDDVIAACQQQLDRLPQSTSGDGISAADIQRRRQFAACMREHGVPMWPDPDAEGRFPNTPELAAEGKTPALVAAQDTCRHFLTGGN